MKKYIITDRRTGLGDVLLNLSACWYLGQRYNRDVIIDWRRLPYNLKNTETWTRYEVNLFHCLFMSPPNLQGVNFLFPENFDEISFGPKTQDGYPFDLDHLPIVDQESKSFESEDKLLKDNNQQFVRCSMRMGQKNDCFHRLRTINKENFNYWFFINSMPLCIPIEGDLNSFKKKVNSKTVGIHFRHGNGEDWWMAGKPKFKNLEESVDRIVEEVRERLEQPLKSYNFRIFSDNPTAREMLFNKLPNSQVSQAKLPEEGKGALHFHTESYPIKSLQDSFLDMMKLAQCTYLFYTEHSTFSIPATHNISKERTFKLFK